MKKIFTKVTTFSLSMLAALVLAGCSTSCSTSKHMKKHHEHRGVPQTQEVVVYEASETVIAEIPMANVMKAQMHTRSRHGGTAEMGYIKFVQTDNGVKMMVDVTDLRPGKEYTAKIYPCGNCSDSSCCAAKCMNVKLPVLSVDEPGRLTKTYNVRGLSCADLANAKIVLTRDGGYKAAWGRIYPAN